MRCSWIRRNPVPAALLLLSPAVLAAARVASALWLWQPPGAAEAPAAERAPSAGPIGSSPEVASIGEATAQPAPIRSTAARKAYARGNVERALELAARDGDAAFSSELEQLQSLYRSALEARASKDTANAIRQLEAALELDAHLVEGGSTLALRMRRQLSKLYAAQGWRLLARKDKAGARRAFAQAIELDRNNVAARYTLRQLDSKKRRGG